MSEHTMRAFVIVAPRRGELREAPMPTPGRGQVLVRVQGCGVCGSNLPIWEGRPWFDYPVGPGTPGHEGWGHAAAVGAGVTSIKEGDRVGFLSNNAFADYDLTTEDGLVVLPPGLERKDVPAEAIGCAMNIWRRSDVHEGQTVAIVGIGFLGALLTQLANRAGARVIAVSHRPYSLQVASRLGARHLFELDPEDTSERILELTEGRGCERVIEAVGRQAPLDVASRLVAVRGRLIVAGFHQDGPRHVDMQGWNWRGIDVINAHERDPAMYVRGMRAGVGELARGHLNVDALLTHRIGLDHAERAFHLLAERPEGFVKAVVTT